jgi:seryl-tRNA synthetase
LRSTKITERVCLEIPIALQRAFTNSNAAQYAATQLNGKINEVQKQIGAKKKAKENADDLMTQKLELEKEKKALIDSAAEKDVALKKKINTIGNIVHDSVPVNNNEVWLEARCPNTIPNLCLGFQYFTADVGTRGS